MNWFNKNLGPFNIPLYTVSFFLSKKQGIKYFEIHYKRSQAFVFHADLFFHTHLLGTTSPFETSQSSAKGVPGQGFDAHRQIPPVNEDEAVPVISKDFLRCTWRRWTRTSDRRNHHGWRGLQTRHRLSQRRISPHQLENSYWDRIWHITEIHWCGHST